ncbi:hypothetical protein A3J20_06465 [Candidatus Gottesmanbacteria bacterium RIFCSPLOWO2_02_FULL_42_29]|nr:MAG: hypothetical protein A3J20_06465 [Candidatus Gottesmanbacteria bacterium RIFCSPLOWO2_02_FULL_42_29]HLD61545.1 prepilin-type N-terminal cleavage/methylation domain-containing protein [Patescibacteria group bacterium]
MEGNGKSFNKKPYFTALRLYSFTASKGQTLMELLLALGIFAFIMTAVFALVFGGLTTGLRSEEQDFATMFAQEGLDAARSIRDTDWGTFISAANGKIHGVNTDANYWAWDSPIDSDANDESLYGARKFIREITVENVSRENGDIVQTGGADDRHTKKITSRVKWNNGLALQDISLSEYLTDWMYPEFIHGIQADFNNTDPPGGVVGLTIDPETVYLTNTPSGPITYTHSSINAGSTSKVMKISWKANVPASAALTLQMRGAPDNSGAPGSWSNWCGPTICDNNNSYPITGDGNSAQIIIPNNQWFQYRLNFTSTVANETPILDKITITAKNLY